MDVGETIVIKRFSTFLLKYTPYFIALMGVFFCAWRGHNLQHHFVADSLGSCGFLWMPYVYLSSFAHKFCKWHRRLLLYDFSITVMVYIEFWIGLGKSRIYFNWFFFLIGMYLVIRVGYLIYTKKYSHHS